MSSIVVDGCSPAQSVDIQVVCIQYSDLTDNLNATSIFSQTLYAKSLQSADRTDVHIQQKRSILQTDKHAYI